ncbi:MAG: LUD domain-containing protein [Brooklawnia sp.]|uniref:LutC/YkgG family protein n=1 Tax=Brooklawnia sp. TaxID=2699740 RepID=UPI003C748F04
MSAKEEILSRVRTALRDVPPGDIETDSPVAWRHGQPVDVGRDIVELFAEQVADYKAAVVQCPADEVPQAIVDALQAAKVGSVVAPPGIEQSWQDAIAASGIRLVVDRPDAPLSNIELNEIDSVVTAAAVGAAQTGTIMLDHTADQGRRALSLVPDVHVCVVRADQVVSAVPEAVARLKPAVLAGQPLTWISGGSATSDIELSRVEGVHGPRTLHVIISQ